MRYVYDGRLVIQERDENNTVRATYVRGLDKGRTLEGAGGIGGLLSRTDGYGTVYYYSDASGNVRALLNEDQHVVARYQYDAYGNMIGQSGGKAEGNLYRFSSKEYHTIHGLYYFGQRYYDPNLQRWLTPDPIQEAGGINLYAYVGNDPVNAIDPWGLDFMFTTSPEVAVRYGFRFADSFADLDIGSARQYVGQMAGFQDGTGLHLGSVYSAADEFLSYTVSAESLSRTIRVQQMIADAERASASPPRETISAARPHPGFSSGLTIGLPSRVAASPVGQAMSDLNTGMISLILPLGPAALRGPAVKGATVLVPARSPWPANSGFIQGTVKRKFLMPGEVVDRYGFGGGRFASPVGTSVQARALRPGVANLPFNSYRVLKPIEVNSGGVQPWFGQRGLGSQHELPVSVNVLLKRGFLERMIP